MVALDPSPVGSVVESAIGEETDRLHITQLLTSNRQVRKVEINMLSLLAQPIEKSMPLRFDCN